MRVELIRHSMTAGNKRDCYIGAGTDEPLCQEGIDLVTAREWPAVDEVYVSPMLRCHQTAELIYPGMEQHVIEDFRECNFGEFENKNYQDLQGNPRYQEWVDSGGELPFPGGDDRKTFSARCVRAFEQVADAALARHVSAIALVVHGGTIMSIMEKYGRPRAGYYAWQMKNAARYTLDYQGPE